jgi:hypothetical protein
MSGTYSDKAIEYLSTQSNGQLISQVMASITPVSVSEGGRRKTVPIKDSVSKFETLAENIFRPSSSFDSMLLNSSPVDINVKLSTISGKIYDMIILFIINNNTGADCELAPIYSWFNRVEFVLGGGNIVQQFFPTDLFAYTWLFDLNEFKLLSGLFEMNDEYLPRRDILPNGSQTVAMLVIPNNWFKQTGLVAAGSIDELNIRLYMAGAANTVISGSPPQVNDVRVQFITNNILHSNKVQAINTMRIGNFESRYWWLCNQQYTQQNISPNTTQDFLLSSFTGLFNIIQFMITAPNPTPLQLVQTYTIKSFDILDENGQSILGQSVGLLDQESRWWDAFVGNPLSEFDDTHNVYKWIASTNVKQDSINGTMGGVYYFNGKSRLRITTEPLRVAKVITISPVGAAFVATAGNFRLLYSSPLTGSLEATPWLAFNTSAANIAIAIQNLPSFQTFTQLVAVSGPISGAAPITVTYNIAQNLGYEELDDKVVLVVESAVTDAGGLVRQFDSAITQIPVQGWPGNPFSFTITLMGQQLASIGFNDQGVGRLYKS